MSRFHDGMTLGEARAILRDLVDDGHDCPCCTQFAKVYRRRLHAAMAASLVHFYRRQGQAWGIASEVLPGVASSQSDFSKLRYWGLIEPKPGEHRDDGGPAGVWRVTDAGVAFIRDRASVLSHARVYDGRCLSLEGTHITIRGALGKRFHYDELMAGV